MAEDLRDSHGSTTTMGALEALIDHLSMTFWATDSDLRVLSFSGRAFLGERLPSTGLTGQNLREIAEEDDRFADLRDAHERALSGESGWFTVERSGATFEGRVAPIVGEGGGVAGCLAFAYEMSGYRSSASELEHLFSLSLQMLCIAGTDGYFKLLNPAFEKTLGFTTEELLSQPFIDFVHPDDREATAHEVRKLAAGLPTVQFENRYRCKDGSYRWLAWTSSPAGKSDLLYATAVDVTERKRAEQFFRELVESAPDAVAVTDTDGRIVLVNRLTEELFGYSREELMGQTIELLVPERFRANHVRHREEYRANPRTRPMRSGVEVRGRRKDGSEFPAEVSLSPLEIDGTPVVFSAVRDITPRKRAEQEMREREAELVAAQEIQKHILPKEVPSLSGFDIAGASFPAHFAGGDHLDYIPLPDGSLGIVLGDVAGHGIPAGLVMASTQAYIRSFAEREIDVSKILVRANRALYRTTEPERFVTTIFARIDRGGRSLRYASAGHPSGFLLDREGTVKMELESTGIPLGVLSDADYPTCLPIPLEPGDTVLLLTDGVLEAESPTGEVFGLARVLTIVRESRRDPAQEIIRSLYAAVRKFAAVDHLQDDVTLVVAKVIGGAQTRAEEGPVG
jgi:sigma-B regulation protein RsbU (phosphoserine phosphatase)